MIKRFLALLISALLVVLGLTIFVQMPEKTHLIKFENEEELTRLSGDTFLFRLDRELLVWVNDHLFVIPKGYVTDLASVPKVLHWKINPKDRSLRRPAILHDYLYEYPNGYSRQDIDEIFYYALREEGNSRYTSYVMYLATRVFGWWFYAR